MTGTVAFLRAFVRRDRWMYVWWGLGVALLYVSQAWSVDGLYKTQAEFDKAATAMQGNAALVAMAGPARALNTTGGQVTWQAAAFGAICAGLMSMFIIGRHTRAEEESGRDELLRAAPVGRYAPMAAALLDAMLANVVLGLLVFGSLAAYGLTVPDSLGLGVGLTLTGWFFSGTALVAAQLTTSNRAAYGLAGATVAVAYVLRAIGDVSTPALSWISPIGWYQSMHAFSGLRWWPALLPAGAAVGVVVLARAIFDRRDFGSGVVATRPGPARAAGGLTSGFGLAWRLQRPAFVGWALGLLVGGLSFGSMGDSVKDLVGDSSYSREVILQGSGNVVDGFYATMIVMLALIAAGFSISSALRPHGEEDAGLLDSLLATGLPRSTWLLGHVAVTAVGTVVVLAASGLGLGLSYAAVTGDTGAVLRLAVPALAYAPAVLVLSGLARLLHGLAPRASVVAWLGLLVAWVVLLFGDLFHMPQWLQDVSPFEHLALMPLQDFRLAPFLVLTLVAAGLSAAGQLGFRVRDVR